MITNPMITNPMITNPMITNPMIMPLESAVGMAHPWLLVVALVLAVGLIGLAVLAGRRRAAALAAAGLRWSGRGPGRLGLWLSLAAVLVIALAVGGPTASLPVGRSAGTVILAMDASNSMSADDVTPSRLAAAQRAAEAFIDAQPDTVDIGVVGFDQGALTTSPPSADRAQAKAAVQNLRTSGGTSLAAAILGSLRAITGKPVVIGKDGKLPDLGYWGSATIVLFSDGEQQGSTTTQATTQAATVAQNAGVHIETVGVGTATGTTVEIDGYRLHTALDARALTALAQSTGGSYHPASDAAQLSGIASTVDLRLTVARQAVPLAGALAGLAILLLAAGAVLTGARTGRLA